MLRGRLAGHVEIQAELPEGLAILFAKAVQQLSASRIAERLEDLVIVHRSHFHADGP